MDCFAEPVIGPRLARTRWLAMTMRMIRMDPPVPHSTLIFAALMIGHQRSASAF